MVNQACWGVVNALGAGRPKPRQSDSSRFGHNAAGVHQTRVLQAPPLSPTLAEVTDARLSSAPARTPEHARRSAMRAHIIARLALCAARNGLAHAPLASTAPAAAAAAAAGPRSLPYAQQLIGARRTFASAPADYQRQVRQAADATTAMGRTTPQRSPPARCNMRRSRYQAPHTTLDAQAATARGLQGRPGRRRRCRRALPCP